MRVVGWTPKRSSRLLQSCLTRANAVSPEVIIAARTLPCNQIGSPPIPSIPISANSDINYRRFAVALPVRMIATRTLRNSTTVSRPWMINNGEGSRELSLLSLSLCFIKRRRIEPLSREIWGRESGTRIINDHERQVFGDNRVELLKKTFWPSVFL